MSGSLSITLRNGWLGTSLLDLAGLSLPAWLLRRVPGGNQADLVSAVAPFTFDKGKATSRGLVLETNDVQVVGVGYIDFQQSEVNVRFKPQALHQQFFKIAQPFAVRGPLSRPRLSLTGSPVTGAVTEFLAFPFNLLQTIVQPATNTPGRVPCRIIHTSTAKAGWLGLLKEVVTDSQSTVARVNSEKTVAGGRRDAADLFPVNIDRLCPLWVISGHRRANYACPFYP